MGFITDEFLLSGESARILYHRHAAELPIFDYHCHLPPAEIASNRAFANITQAWLAGDHYKWRAMRAQGVAERLITGDADDREKFQAWAETVPATVGNPLYQWTHLELRRPFGIDDLLLDGSTAQEIWEQTGDLLARPQFTTRGILKQMRVRFVCTTDDPLDDLAAHKAMAADRSLDLTVLPAFRPDKAVHIEAADTFRAWVRSLEGVAGRPLGDYTAFLDALGERIDYFHSVGARVSDHAMLVPPYREASAAEVAAVYRKVMGGKDADALDAEAFQTAVLLYLGREYARRGWVMQYHISALRNTNTRAFRELGPDTGYDSIADFPIAAPLNRLLGALDNTDELPKTILYSLDASKNDVLATTVGNFQDGSTPGKLQFGSGWWYHDQKDGILKQMTSLANMGLLSRFVGMLTDSRSFLSFPRHDYFRRILCNLVGGWVDSGEAPRDFDLLGSMIGDICWNNAVRYFGVPVKEH